MKKILAYIAVIVFVIAIYLVQLYIIDSKTLFGVKPNLLLILSVTVSLWYGLYVGSVFSFLTGFTLDLIFGNAYGLFTITYTIIGVIIGYINYNYRKENKVSLIYITIFATILFEIIESIFYLVITHTYINIFYILKQIIIASLLNICLAYVMYFLLYKLTSYVDKYIFKTSYESIG